MTEQTRMDAHEAGTAAGDATPTADGPPPRRRRRKDADAARPDPLDAARERMENSLLERRKAMSHCNVCGAQGNWDTESVKKPIRYLKCGHCRVGTIQIVVTDADVAAALGQTKS